MQMEWSYVGAVVISGLVIVFVALILLIIAVTIMGGIFDALNGKKKKKAEVKTAPAAVPAPAAPSKPVSIPSSDDDEVIAVIAAAVAAMAQESGKDLRIASIRPAAARTGKSRSNAWARAAANESTRAF